MKSAAELLERAGELFPHRPALSFMDETLSYSQLRRQSCSLAGALKREGISGKAPVAVYLPKGNACVVSAFGALYFGAPYSPLDYNCPTVRLNSMLKTLMPACVITDAEGELQLKCAECDAPVFIFDELLSEAEGYFCEDVIDTDPAYIMFTSGSTGNPKGVAISHAAVLDYAQWAVHTFDITSETVFAQQSGFHFDNSIFHIFASVLSGAELIIIPDPLLKFPKKLTEFLAEKRINFIFWAPTVLMSIANSGALDDIPLPCLKNVFFGGEVMPVPQLEKWQRALPHCRFANMFGPTEITDVCCFHVIEPGERVSGDVPIGKVRHNMRAYILDENGLPVAEGEIGELCISGIGLALGYWNDPQQTALHFSALHFGNPCGERIYKTGDLAFSDPNGILHFCGRKDSQIKLRGNRIELSDVEAASQNIPDITNACALYDAESEKIVLFLETAQQLVLRKINLLLRDYLPAYMLPGRLICLEKFPVNKNRKVDRIQLKEMIN